MITEKDDLLKSLIKAFLMEKGTREFYSLASEKASGSGAKKIFNDLAGWEEKHMEFIRFLYQSVNEESELSGFAEFQKRTHAPVTEAGIPVKDLESRMEKYTVTDEAGALKLALEIEGKAYNLYRRLSETAGDTNARVIFREMMDQEVGHIESLKKLKADISS